MKNLNNIPYILLISTLLFGCSSLQEKKSILFFKKWRNDTEEFILKYYPKTELEKDINAVLNLEFCSYDYSLLRKDFPNLEYEIYPENIKVTMCYYISNYNPLEDKNIIFYDSIFKNTIDCTSPKTLILFEKYKEKLPKKRLKYGFGYLNTDKNRNNAKVILSKHHNSKYFRLSGEKPISIAINKNKDTLIIQTMSTYVDTHKRYIKIDNKWIFDKTLIELTE